MGASRVLIVEDDAIVASHLSRVVSQMGFEVAGLTATGLDAIAAATSANPDVILMDIRLRGEMNGVEAAERIRAVSDTPVIYLSAYADESYVKQATSTQPYGYLTKPVRDKELKASIEVALFKAHTDRHLHHVNQILRAMRQINELIARDRDSAGLVHDVCSGLLGARDFVRVSIALVDPGSGVLHHTASAGADGATPDDVRDFAPCGLALASGRVLLIQDLEAEGVDPAFCRIAAACHCGSLATVHMAYAGRVFGVLCVHARHKNAFDEEETVLLTQLATDVAWALHTREIESDKQRSEDALRRSEEAFRDLVENVNDVIYSITADGTVAYVNPVVREVFGYEPSELTGKPFTTLIVPEDLARIRDAFTRVAAGTLRPSVYRMLTKGGEIRWVRTSSRPWVEAGRVVGLRGVLADITAAHEAEERLQAQYSLLRAVLESAGAAFFSVDREYRYASFNLRHAAMMKALHGVDIEVGRSMLEVQPRNQKATPSTTNIDRALAGESFIEEEVSDEPGHPTRHFEVAHSPIRDLDGTITGVGVFARDVTERVRAAEALRESEESFRSFLENTVIGAYRTTPEGLILLANPAMAYILGFDSVPELLVENVETLSRAGSYDRDAFQALVAREGTVSGYETTWTRADGSVIHVREHARCVRNADGSVKYYEGTFEDLTAQRALEEQLRRAQKLQSVGRLAAGVAHDFNNLLQAMMNHAQLLVAHASERDQVVAHGAEVERSLRRGATLTRQLLLFSRQEMAKPERLDLNAVVRSAAEMLRRLVRENVSFELDLAPTSLAADADHGQLDQVLMNLVVNGSDAMPDGGALVIRSGRRGNDVWFSVGDTGIGMSEDVVRRAFEPFFTTKAAGRGTGLGLSVVHGIVSYHGGSVEVETGRGRGSTFRIILPKADSGIFHIPKQQPESAEPDKAAGYGERILVIEDEEGARKSLAEILEMLGYEVVAVGSGEDAADLPGEPPFDLVLSDIMLPGMSGADTVVGLLKRWPGLKVIMMSGYTEEDAPRHEVGSDLAQFLQKPFDIDTLARTIRAALSPRAQRMAT
jgi:two-component system, cell cycle sensor histidine kinase and response regulator CckA